MSKKTEATTRFVTAPGSTVSAGQVLSVAVGPDEEVQWIWSHDAQHGSYVSGYSIVPRLASLYHAVMS